MDKIRVIARIRPMVKTEIKRQDTCCVSKEANNLLLAAYGVNQSKKFTFDQVLDSDSTQDIVFLELIPALSNALLGYNTSIYTHH